MQRASSAVLLGVCVATASAAPGLLRGRWLSANPCAHCGVCVEGANSGNQQLQGGTCQQCANDAYTFWPCNSDDLCQCSDDPTLVPTPALPTREPTPGTTARVCTHGCSICVAVPNNQGVADGDCSACIGDGTKHWPCWLGDSWSTDLCQCRDGASVPTPASSTVDPSTAEPTAAPTDALTTTGAPTDAPTEAPATLAPTGAPTPLPTAAPPPASTASPMTEAPTATPTAQPTRAPTAAPTALPTAAPTDAPSVAPPATPSAAPTPTPTGSPTVEPSLAPTDAPTVAPTQAPSAAPTSRPTAVPTVQPSASPTTAPTSVPTREPTEVPTAAPTTVPTAQPSAAPTATPTSVQTQEPTAGPTAAPTRKPNPEPAPEHCSEGCSGCVSVQDNVRNEAINDEQCADCLREAHTWWPCFFDGTPSSDLCRCTDVAAPSPAPPPTLAPVPTPQPTRSPTSSEVCTATPSTCDDWDIGDGISSWFTKADFDRMFPHICSASCRGCEMLTYNCLIKATLLYPDFAASGSMEDNKRELAAWLGEMSQETTGGGCIEPTVEGADGTCSCSPTWCDSEADGGCARWGLCFVKEAGGTYCSSNSVYPCQPGKEYKGRGPKQLSYNYNYGQFSEQFCGDKNILLQNPEWVAENPVLAWASSMWFWFTGGACMPWERCKPSCHDVFLGKKDMCPGDESAGRRHGLGWVTNVINGGLECGGATDGKCDYRVHSRVRFYKHFCGILGVDPLKEGWTEDGNLYCDDQKNYAESPPELC